MTLPRKRLLLLAALLATWAVVVIARLVQIQIVRHEHYELRAQKQQERTVALTPVRGSIRDAKGRLLADSVVAESIYADPQAIDDPEETARKLAAVDGLKASRSEIEKRLRRRGEFAWIARQVSPETAAEVRRLGLKGVSLLEEHTRTYPKGELASNVIGYVGIDGEGLAGLEHGSDHSVRGRAGKVTLLRDARRGMYLVGGHGSHAPVDGHHVVLTIDEVIQFIAERALASAAAKYRAAGGVAVVMDPASGAVLAMASWPTFDPNRYGDASPAEWRNRAVQDLYEPGSTFKIVTAAAGLEEGVVTPSDILDCAPGYVEIAGVRIREHGGKQFGLLTFEDVLAQSSNVGTIRVGQMLGRERLYDYVRRFGFGEQTGIELPGEAAGIVRETRRWSQLSSATISMGQEVAATPLQVLTAAATIANGGMRPSPHLVRSIVDGDGAVVDEPQRRPQVRVVSEKTAAVLNEMLKSSVTRGTGKAAAVDGHVVAGKTGTAQKAARGGYSPDRFVASFVGYVPADRPRLAILVAIDEPKGNHYGGVVAAPAFREIAEGALRYLGVEPSLPLRELQLPQTLLAGFSQPAERQSGGGSRGQQTPDLRGLDARSALAEATAAGLTVRTSGSGFVREQFPLPGTTFRKGDEITLTLSTRRPRPTDDGPRTTDNRRPTTDNRQPTDNGQANEAA